METKSVSKIYTLNKTTYINLRWIAITGQFIAINFAALFLKFEFSFIKSNIIILFGAISNIYLLSFYSQVLPALVSRLCFV